MIWLNNLLLKSPSPQLRRKAIENLTGSGKSRDTDHFVASLGDESPQVRCAAVRALEKVKTIDSARSIAAALRDASYEVREAAARALSRLGFAASTTPLAAALKDPDPAVLAAVAGALRALGWKPSTSQESARFEIALGNIPAPIRQIQAASPEVRFDTQFLRRAAADAVRAMNDPGKIALLVADLHHNDPKTRISAVHALGQLSSDSVTVELLKLFRDRDPAVRSTAVQVLAMRDDPPPAHFVGLLGDPDFEVRLAAVQFLGRVRHPHIAEVLLPLLSDPDADVRQATATALGLIRHASAIEPLMLKLSDANQFVRQAVEKALEQLNYVPPAQPVPAAG
jgi:HEAT repeat protein